VSALHNEQEFLAYFGWLQEPPGKPAASFTPRYEA
jgi:hypothetical protein